MPARQPTHLKLVKGTQKPCRVNRKEPRPALLENLTPPQSLSTRGMNAWRRLAPELRRLGVLTTADTFALQALCECYGEAMTYRAAIKKAGGPTYETHSRTGELMIRARPEVAMLADADRRLRLYLGEFGLTPASRGKVSADPDGRRDPLDDYFAQH
jgi:P27 family predicted phage terminase small subunit